MQKPPGGRLLPATKRQGIYSMDSGPHFQRQGLPTSFRRQKHNPGETSVANVYIEARPKGHTEGDRIDHYVVEDHADHVLAAFPTQREAIEWAKRQRHDPL